MLSLFHLLSSYYQARRLSGLNALELKRHQAKKIPLFLDRLCRLSPYFSTYRGLALAQFPMMDKALMLTHFNTMNTVGLTLKAVMDTALQAEYSRDFSSTIKGFTVGLSSGTTAQRGAFVVSAKEKARWAGIMLAKALPDGLLAGERVALFLRANSNLYTSVNHGRLRLAYFDLFLPLSSHLTELNRLQPSIIVAPAQVLRRLADAKLAGHLCIKPKRVYSAAEVLEQQDRQVIELAFGNTHEIYQATEGFLACTCEAGVLHLNEEYIHIEPEWLDAEKRRFVPIITDFSRMTQPIVRYRLNDVLIAKQKACSCGRASMALEAVEGRCDDMLLLPNHHGCTVTIFADVLSRALAQVLPLNADYRCTQIGPEQLRFQAPISTSEFKILVQHLNQVLGTLGVACNTLQWQFKSQLPPPDLTRKRRRIVREWQA